VQTSLHEGYCLTIHEAKMFNKAVVTTDVASASNLIVDQQDGLIVPISIDGLCDGIKKMLLDTELLKKCSRALLASDTTAEINMIL
jgi:glycosyltransferase involved in cell wall biosynthesis